MADAPPGVTEDGLKAALMAHLQATHVEIEDMSGGCGQAFSAIIVSPHFAKKNSLARARLVNTALKSEIAAIHAWTARCHTPEEWAGLRGEEGGGEGLVRAPGKKGVTTMGEVVVGMTGLE